MPYGVGITYANIKHDMILDNLQVGFNGGPTSGTLKMYVLLDGDEILTQSGTDCSGIIKPVRCRVLEGRTFDLPITPRGGLSFDLGNQGRLSLFAGCKTHRKANAFTQRRHTNTWLKVELILARDANFMR